MIILTLRTDKPGAELGLYQDSKQISYITWEAHRQLAETLHSKIKLQLDSEKLAWNDIGAIVVYAGPGSFTGLRIGISTVNALAFANNALIVGETGDDWIKNGIDKILSGNAHGSYVVPEYGSDVHITVPKK